MTRDELEKMLSELEKQCDDKFFTFSQSPAYFRNYCEELIPMLRDALKCIEEKDETIKYCLGPTRDVKVPHLEKALALKPSFLKEEK